MRPKAFRPPRHPQRNRLHRELGSQRLSPQCEYRDEGVELQDRRHGGVLTPTVANGIVYVGSDDHNVYPLNANTGTKVWNYTTGDMVTCPPKVANGVVYVGSYDHNVYAPQCEYRDEGVELQDRRLCGVLPHRRQRNRLCGGLGPQRLCPQCEYRDEGVELHDRRPCAFLPHRRQRNRLCGGLGPQRLCPQCEYRDEGVELHDRRPCDLLPHRRQRNRLRRER